MHCLQLSGLLHLPEEEMGRYGKWEMVRAKGGHGVERGQTIILLSEYTLVSDLGLADSFHSRALALRSQHAHSPCFPSSRAASMAQQRIR